ncbi:MAG TPA: sulfatase-like hydrolase/transferase, partial [Acidobacteriota bacterium]|nr:sulfatase-like hydrolase/transferase [Acidobacteriota bacterium]
MIPLALYLVYVFVGKLGATFQNGYRAIVFALLTAFILMPAVRNFHPFLEVFLMFWFLLLSFILFFVGYKKLSWMQSYLLFLSPAILIVPALFVTHWQIKKLYAAEKEVQVTVVPKNPAPVIILVFDEFPLVTLLNKDLQIDSHLFPNFYKLSQQASFYRNATTSADQTVYAIPAILTGKYPKPHSIAVPIDYPNTLFTLLSDTYSMQATEFGTKLFPDQEGSSRNTTSRDISQIASDLLIIYGHLVLPQPLKSKLPSVTNNWGNFTIRQNQIRSPDHRAGRQKTFDDYLGSLKKESKPILRYLHILLPHRIWEFLPSGRIYDPFEIESIAMGQTVSWENETIVKESYQRLLLQVQFLDRLIGTLIAKLEQEDLYDSALIILVGDHGIGLTEREEFRKVEKNNFPEMLWIPLLIKYPNQKTGKTFDWNVESVDILPTVADVLKFTLPWKGDGYSLIQSAPPRKEKKCFMTDSQTEKI